MNPPIKNEVASQIKQMEEEIRVLKEELKKPHLTRDAEQDYDIKSRIIDKQNEMIELLLKQRDEKLSQPVK